MLRKGLIGFVVIVIIKNYFGFESVEYVNLNGKILVKCDIISFKYWGSLWYLFEKRNVFYKFEYYELLFIFIL